MVRFVSTPSLLILQTQQFWLMRMEKFGQTSHSTEGETFETRSAVSFSGAAGGSGVGVASKMTQPNIA